MARNKADMGRQAAESMGETLEIGLAAAEKLEEIWEQGVDDAFEAAQSGLRQMRSASVSLGAGMPWAAAMQPAADAMAALQEKNLESARSGAKAGFGVYRRSVAAPMRKLARENAAKLAEKAGV